MAQAGRPSALYSSNTKRQYLNKDVVNEVYLESVPKPPLLGIQADQQKSAENHFYERVEISNIIIENSETSSAKRELPKTEISHKEPDSRNSGFQQQNDAFMKSANISLNNEVFSQDSPSKQMSEQSRYVNTINEYIQRVETLKR